MRIIKHRYLELQREIMILELVLDYVTGDAKLLVEKQISEKYVEFEKEQVNYYNNFADMRDISLGVRGESYQSR